MKIYELMTFGETQIVKRTEEDGKEYFIPLDPANSDYAEYLAYTAWVEAGNNPEEFWSQTL